MGRHFIGIERDKTYARVAKQRVSRSERPADMANFNIPQKRTEPRVPFGTLLECGLIAPGTKLFDTRKRFFAKVRADGTLIAKGRHGSIHKVGAEVQGHPLATVGHFGTTKKKGERSHWIIFGKWYVTG